jgi:hypothetical protein
VREHQSLGPLDGCFGQRSTPVRRDVAAGALEVAAVGSSSDDATGVAARWWSVSIRRSTGSPATALPSREVPDGGRAHPDRTVQAEQRAAKGPAAGGAAVTARDPLATLVSCLATTSPRAPEVH